ncbi:hypothetical protein J6590_042014 [Homalodisca vitripennis]|nr:hypothetical protein J6590_042014 [Homalodisca vitripennis]
MTIWCKCHKGRLACSLDGRSNVTMSTASTIPCTLCSRRTDFGKSGHIYDDCLVCRRVD